MNRKMRTLSERILTIFMLLATLVNAQLTPEQQKMVEQAEQRTAEALRIQDSLMNTPEMKRMMEQLEAMDAQQQELNEARQGESSKNDAPTSVEPTASLTISGKGYQYAAINKAESRIYYDEGVWIELHQGNLPVIVFEFPTIERFSAIRQYEFELPEFNQVDSREPIVFQFLEADETLIFEGALRASLIQGILEVTFDGVGKPQDGNGDPRPVSGEFRASFN